MMRVLPAVVRRGRIRKHSIIGDIVRVNSTESERRGIDRVNHWRAGSQVAQKRDDRDGHDVIAKTATIRPAAWYDPVAEA